MDNSLDSDSGRSYSWLWDSHISPKNSKWLQENLTDMDAKVKTMIRLIESDADSFGRRAEMYYKKRPELMTLVEEFYRAYRALAERYDHATAELRHAQRTMAKAFPNELPFVLPELSASCSQGPGAELHTPEKLDPDTLNNNPIGLSSSNLQTLIGALTDSSDSESGVSKKVLKWINEMFGPEEVTLSPLKPSGEREQDGCMTAETVEILKEALAEIKYEKKVIFMQYLQSFDWALSLDREPSRAQKDDNVPEEWPTKAETEVNTLRESLVKCEAERDTWLLQHRQCLERISNIESMVSRAHANATGMVERAVKAETETQDLKFELTKLESEKQTTILQFKQCLEKVSALEDKISCAEEDAQKLADQTNSTEVEVQALKQALAESNKEKESIAIQYEQCLEMISKLKSENSWTQEDAKKLEEELENTKERCAELEKSNYSLQLEVGDAAQKIIMKDRELQKKLEELEKVKIYSQNENSHFLQAEAALFALQTLHSQTLEEHGTSVLETKNALQMVKDLEACKQDTEGEIQRINKENSSLKDLIMSSTVLRENMEAETIKLRSTKSKLEEELADERCQINSLQKDICCLKEEIKGLNWRYQALVGQLESVDLDPKRVVLSVKAMQDDNLKLTKLCENGKHEIETLSKKLKNSGILLEKNALLEQSLLEERKIVRSMQESYQTLIEEKSALAAEKAALFSQLQTSTDTMQTLLEKNDLLDQSLSAANIELQGLKEKSKWFEESCSLLNTEKSGLLTQRETLVSQLEVVEERLASLKKGFTELEKRYTGLEDEKERILHQVEELQFCLSVEKQEQASFVITSEAQLVGLKNHINLLQEESQWWRKEFEDALKNTVNAQTEIFILQRCMQDVEENNICLLNDCQKHIQAFEFSEKLISQLECENLEQQVELEVLMDEIEKRKTGIYKISKALQTERENESDREQLIIGDIEEMKSSLLRIEDERQKLLVENSVLLNLIKGLGLEGAELENDKKITSLELKNLRDMFTSVENDKDLLQERNRLLLVKIGEGDKWEEVLQANIEGLNQKLVDLQGKFNELLKVNSKEIEEKTSLSKEFFELTEEKCLLEEDNSRLLQEAIYFNNLFLIYQCFGTENLMEMKYLAKELGILQKSNGALKMEAGILKKKLEREKLKKSHLKDSVKVLDYEVYKSRDLNIQLNGQILDGNDLLFHKENELSKTGEKLVNVEALNTELCRTIEELEKECDESKLARENLENQISDFSLHSLIQNEEIEFLREVNGNLESEIRMLQKDFEQCRIRSGNLSSEVLKKSYESRFWEAESATFYFDLQISSVREILFKDKVLELTSVYESLKDESASKSMEIEQMKARVRFLEGEIGGLETQLSAYGPAIHSLEENIASLERNAFFRTKLFMDDDQEQKEAEVVVDFKGEPHKGQTATVPVGLSNLLNIQKRVKVVEKAVIKEIERLAMQEIFNANIKLEAAVKKTEDSKSENKLHQQKSVRKEGKLPVSKMRGDSDLHKTVSGRKRIFLKKTSLDRVLGCPQTIRWRNNVGPNDQMLMLRETREQDYCHSPIRQMTKMQASATNFLQPRFEDIEQERWNNSSKFLVNKKLGANKLDVSTSGMHSKQGINQIDILERQASNARKLQTLQMTVQDIKRKMELRKRSKKASKVAKYELVEEELQETEEAIVQLVDNNSQLMQNTEESPLLLAPAGLEVAQKGSEKIGRLQLEVQKMQYILLNLEDEKKRKGRYRVFKIRSRSRPSPHVREYIYSEGRSSEKHRKGCLSGCLRPSCEAD